MYRRSKPAAMSARHCCNSSPAKAASSIRAPTSMLRLCPRSVKLAEVTSARTPSTTTHFACRLAHGGPFTAVRGSQYTSGRGGPKVHTV